MSYKYTIAFDANGNDKGVMECFLAAQRFASENPDTLIKLVGDIAELSELNNNTNLELIENKNKPSDPRNIRKSMHENTSMNQSIALVLDNQADAVISSGDSGTYISALTLKAKRLNGVSRPAFMPVATAANERKFVMLDVGANLETKTEYYVEWASLASTFYSAMFNKQLPQVALINIGTEDYKGSQTTQEAHQLLKEHKEFEYLGFMEPKTLFDGKCDVVVTDGYAGNIMIKSYEGAIETFTGLLKKEVKNSFLAKIGGLFMKPSFRNVAKKLDYRSIGSAWVIGVNALALKAHGSSDNFAYYNALRNIKQALEVNLLAKLQEAMEKDAVQEDN
ncbi:phosphate acyltransferase PlsX [Mycoplasmopsis verecunda]|uniref:Phosphate acyltransferase n=1 Tax=Mycoplasmopsis verecunda TaxID=171291 RepID=A0A1T4KYP6_9BACT|nr:phosphate acyltransferase PlsX [Mycoplasmopsis verecunda]WPB54350.1 phosphate acyltransferase PlsX [Mycoplasmopsis verecunda]SJZ47460.1 phosphate:acyl-[acyl carrier protein] acyltransferase [Mycoplasmopsis verecunda]